jgi:hypothetical protein
MKRFIKATLYTVGSLAVSYAVLAAGNLACKRREARAQKKGSSSSR